MATAIKSSTIGKCSNSGWSRPTKWSQIGITSLLSAKRSTRTNTWLANRICSKIDLVLWACIIYSTLNNLLSTQLSKLKTGSGDQVLHNPTRHVCQSKASSQMFVNHFFMVNPQLMKYRSLEVVDVYRVFDNVIPKIIRFPVYDAGLYPASGHPDRKTFGMVVSSVIVHRHSALAVIGSSKLPSPDYQGFIEQASLF